MGDMQEAIEIIEHDITLLMGSFNPEIVLMSDLNVGVPKNSAISNRQFATNLFDNKY